MSINQGSIFKARKTNVVKEATPESNTSNTSSIGSTTVELTKNEKYCVSKLPAIPSILTNENESAILNGYSDHISNYSLVVDEKAIHVWNYKSTDPTPLLVQFPLEQSSSLLPLAILSKPSSGISQDPGLVIINSSTGLVKFYESVQNAPALGLINNKFLELTLDINQKNGEFITLAENVEPAGVVVATSWKRCILITLRDFRSKSHLTAIELLPPSHSKGLFTGIFNRFQNRDSNTDDEIVSVKIGNVSNNGMTQEIIIQDSKGEFNLFMYQIFSENGNPYIDRKKSIRQNIIPYLENSIEGVLPGASLDVKIFDLWPLALEEQDKTYLGLVGVGEPFSASNNSLYLMSFKIDKTGVLLYGSHKLTSFRSSPDGLLSIKPKLYVPAPGKTAFITYDDSVIMTDLDLSYINSHSSSYVGSRWEDVINFKSSVKIIGQGYENQSLNSNPSIIIITSNAGILRIERFINSTKKSEESSDGIEQFDIVKSHIEQAIFYPSSNIIDFDVVSNSSDDTVIRSVNQVMDEILYSTSQYLPTFFPSVTDYLKLKCQVFHRLVKYCRVNYSNIWEKIAPKLLEYLEKSDLAFNLWNYVNNDSAITNKAKNIMTELIRELNLIEIPQNEDVLRKYFSQGVSSIHILLTELVEKLSASDTSAVVLSSMIEQALYSSVIINELENVIKSDIKLVRKLWIFDTSILVRIDEIFRDVYCDPNNAIFTEQASYSRLVNLCEMLYYFVNNAIDYMKEYENSNEQLIEYTKWYKQRKSHWINALLKHHLDNDAIRIAEEFNDFSTIARILDTEKKNIVESYGTSSLEYENICVKFGTYLSKYGYTFARALFDYYLKTGNIQALITNESKYLNEYLHINNTKASEISWIKYLLDGNYSFASEALLNSVKTKSEEDLGNTQLKFSLAKLTAIASKNKKDSMESDKENEAISESNKHLIQIRSQLSVYDLALKYVSGEKELLKCEYFIRAFVNESIDTVISKDILNPFFDQFVENKGLLTADLINLLSILKPSLKLDNFSKALKISSLITNDSIFKLYAKIIWLRLLTTTDDWSELSNTKDKTDEYVKNKIHETVLFNTLKSIKGSAEILHELGSLVKDTESLRLAGHENPIFKSLDSALLLRLEEYIMNYDLLSWIDSIRQELQYDEYL